MPQTICMYLIVVQASPDLLAPTVIVPVLRIKTIGLGKKGRHSLATPFCFWNLPRLSVKRQKSKHWEYWSNSMDTHILAPMWNKPNICNFICAKSVQTQILHQHGEGPATCDLCRKDLFTDTINLSLKLAQKSLWLYCWSSIRHFQKPKLSTYKALLLWMSHVAGPSSLFRKK